MTFLQPPALRDDTVQSLADSEEPVSAWSLNELEQLSDLESVRSAWSRTDDPYG